MAFRVRRLRGGPARLASLTSDTPGLLAIVTAWRLILMRNICVGVARLAWPLYRMATEHAAAPLPRGLNEFERVLTTGPGRHTLTRQGLRVDAPRRRGPALRHLLLDARAPGTEMPGPGNGDAGPRAGTGRVSDCASASRATVKLSASRAVTLVVKRASGA